MVKRIVFGLIWVAFGTYAFLYAPTDQPETNTLIQNLIAGHIEGINPAIVALFNIMGVIPGIYACLLFADGRGQKIPAWIFVILSFFIGAFGLLPYLALRKPNPTFIGKQNWLIKVFDSKLTGILLAIAAAYLVAYGVWKGDWIDFIHQFQTNRFIHVMSLDFCLLCLLFPWLLSDDMQRRGMENNQTYMLVSVVPLFGVLSYLCMRSPLISSEPSQNQTLAS
ncbi:hypothetical protein Syn7502_00120 [Synechococcus sp. PCC 7502]|nr:hypothetical protein Syn7502_00120 [Synechococcus sp. PCC 7502]